VIARLRRIGAIAAREWRSTFVAPSGWIVLSIFGIVAAVAFFSGTFADARPATLRTVLLACGWSLLATAPAMSMRSFSDEFRLKTWETLFASPLSTAEMVLGKTAACAGIVATCLLPVALLAVPLEAYAAPDYGEIACGLLGLFLAGFAAGCLGIAVSSATSSQAVAFLGAFFLWLGLVAGSRILTGVLPIEHAPLAAGLDPMKRLEGFALGLFDTAAIGYFLAIAATAVAFAIVSLERVRGRSPASWLSRGAVAGERAFLLAGVVCCAAASVALLSRPALRVELDATKTRAYSLAPSTVDLLRGLEGRWQVLLFVDAAQSDPAVLRQIDEVLERFRDANDAIDARRIDPADPASSGAFEEALAGLVASRSSDLAKSEAAVARALGVYDRFRTESGSQPAGLRAAAQQLPADSSVRRTLEQLAAMFAQISTEGEEFRKGVVELSRTSATRPLPDIEGARSALAQGFRVWGDQLASAASLFTEWRGQAAIPQSVRNVAAGRIARYEEIASEMASARAELEALPALEVDALGRELVKGEAAVVAGGGRIAVIPAWRIFPKNVASSGTDRVSYSWGFRGEEVLSGAIRSIGAGAMPEVIFVHSERDSLLRARQDHTDLVAVADALRSAGFGVREWTPGRGERPAKQGARPQVFVVIPALRRAQLDLAREEKLLVEEVVRLVSDGEPVLVTAGRSMLSVLGQPDPWQDVLAPFGIEPDAAKVVLELVAREDGTPEVRPWQLIERAPPDSPLAARLRGRAILLNQPLAVRRMEQAPADVTVKTVVEVPASPERWLADDWRGDGDGVREVPAGKALAAPLSVAVVAERKVPGGTQRAALVGSGGWLLSSVADLSDNLGGGRTALVNPGNRELLLSMVAWLSRRDDLLDAGLSGREVSRIEGLSDGMRRAWGIGYGGVVALGPIVVGAVVIGRRRRRG
jgi:ABC-2 type transport system permease protein